MKLQAGLGYYLVWAYHKTQDGLIKHTNRGVSGQKVVLISLPTPCKSQTTHFKTHFTQKRAV